MTSDRETCLNCARVYLAEAKNRRHSGNFYWVLVPREPTQPMRDAGNAAIREIQNGPTPSIGDRAFYAYRAMLAAVESPK